MGVPLWIGSVDLVLLELEGDSGAVEELRIWPCVGEMGSCIFGKLVKNKA